MAIRSLLFLALVAVAYAKYALVGGFGGHGLLAPQSSKRVLTCAAKLVDHVMLREIERCANEFSVGISGMHGDGSRHLVTMTRADIVGTFVCIAQSGNRIAQRKLIVDCFQKRPVQLQSLFNLCRDKIVGASGDAIFDIVAVKPFLINEMYECMEAGTHGLSHIEVQQQAVFEQCARQVKAETC